MVFLLVNWKLSLPNMFISPSEQMWVGWKPLHVILTCYSLTGFKKKKKITSARLGVMWRKSFLQCRNRTRLKLRYFHIIGELGKWALEFTSWVGDWQLYNGEEKALIRQWHNVPVWDSRHPRQVGCRGPEQHSWQPRLSVSQVGTPSLPAPNPMASATQQMLLGELLPHPQREDSAKEKERAQPRPLGW